MNHQRLLRSEYAWVPSIFRVSDDGTDVQIKSYINGLGPREDFPILYRLIEKVFLLALPHLERTLYGQYVFWDSYRESPAGVSSPKCISSPTNESIEVERWFERAALRRSCTQVQWNALLARQKKRKEKQENQKTSAQEKIKAQIRRDRSNLAHFDSLDDSTIVSSYSGRDLKVIVRV
jgi:hypothetical protein